MFGPTWTFANLSELQFAKIRLADLNVKQCMPGLQIEIADNQQELGQNVTDVEILK